MNLADAAKAFYERQQAAAREEHDRIREETFDATQRQAAQWAATVLTTGNPGETDDQTEELRTAANWDYVEEIWPEDQVRPQITVRCVSDGLDFQYYAESEGQKTTHHFQVLVRKQSPDYVAQTTNGGNSFFRDWEYTDVRDLAHLGQLAAEGRLAYLLRSGGFITTDELEKREAWAADPKVTWTTCHTDEPGDQQADLYGPFWGQVGPSHPDGWSWTLLDSGFDGDGAELNSNTVATEEEAKAAVVQYLIENYLLETAL